MLSQFQIQLVVAVGRVGRSYWTASGLRCNPVGAKIGRAYILKPPIAAVIEPTWEILTVADVSPNESDSQLLSDFVASRYRKHPHTGWVDCYGWEAPMWGDSVL
jgi:hypothetical protein